MLEKLIEKYKDDLIKECISLSYGTISSCTGKSKYSEVDSFLESWIKWIKESPIVFNNWKDAINLYMQET